MRYGYDEYAETAVAAPTHHVHHVAYNVCEIDELPTIQEAMGSEYATEWKASTD